MSSSQTAVGHNGAVGSTSRSRTRPAAAILVGGVIVGVLDMTYAIVVYSPQHPLRIPQHIASGLLGPKSFSGGIATVVLGTALHFTIALGAATVYFLASRRLPVLLKRPVLCGIIFGALVYAFMHTVVVPLSAVAKGGQTPAVYQIAEFIWHWFGVGLPIALSVRRYSR